MCLDHTIANEIYHFFHTLPLKLAPACFIKQCGTSRTQAFKCKFDFLKMPIQRYITSPKKFKNLQLQNKKRKIYSCLATVDHSIQKNGNGEMIAGFFCTYLLHKIGYLVFDRLSINNPMKVSNI